MQLELSAVHSYDFVFSPLEYDFEVFYLNICIYRTVLSFPNPISARTPRRFSFDSHVVTMRLFNYLCTIIEKISNSLFKFCSIPRFRHQGSRDKFNDSFLKCFNILYLGVIIELCLSLAFSPSLIIQINIICRYTIS